MGLRSVQHVGSPSILEQTDYLGFRLIVYLGFVGFIGTTVRLIETMLDSLDGWGFVAGFVRGIIENQTVEGEQMIWIL